jgi:hypothetical protein
MRIAAEFQTACGGIVSPWVSFEEAWLDSIETSFGKQGLPVRVLSKANVILSKEDSSRPRDADDVKKLLEAG